MGNLGILVTIILGRTAKTIFLGALRPSEIELLIDRMKSTVFDTLLIMTIFRDDFSTQFIVLFTVLLFSKTFHWLAQDRVDYVGFHFLPFSFLFFSSSLLLFLSHLIPSYWQQFDQSPMITTLNYIRIAILLVLLVITDIVASHAAIVEVLARPSMMLLFASEFVLLLASSLNTVARFGLHLWDLRHDGHWESKGVVLMYMEFGFDIFRLIVHIVFSLAMRQYYGLSLHVLRQIYITLRSFKKRITEIIHYRRATANMDQRFPDATPEELVRTDAICIVCREEMTTGKKLPCGHILHYMCLRSWLERAQQCPTCRRSVFVENQQQQATETPEAQRQQQQQQQGQPPVQGGGQQPPEQPILPPDANQFFAGLPQEHFIPFQQLFPPGVVGAGGVLPPNPLQTQGLHDTTQQMLAETHAEISRHLLEVSQHIFGLVNHAQVLQENLRLIEHQILSLQTMIEIVADTSIPSSSSSSSSSSPSSSSLSSSSSSSASSSSSSSSSSSDLLSSSSSSSSSLPSSSSQLSSTSSSSSLPHSSPSTSTSTSS
jgi:E3 ubiquitin-protein ligase synoviolin